MLLLNTKKYLSELMFTYNQFNLYLWIWLESKYTNFHPREWIWTLLWHHNELAGVSNHQPRDCLFNVYSRADQTKNIKAPRHWPFCGEFTGTGEFPAQRASNAANVSIWWRHHENDHYTMSPFCWSLNVVTISNSWCINSLGASDAYICVNLLDHHSFR